MATKKATSTPPEVVVLFGFERETKRKVRFKESDATSLMGNVYLDRDKWAELGEPNVITVRITAGS